MKKIVFLSFLFITLSFYAGAQDFDNLGNEPTKKQLGAPLYPGSVFIRETAGLNPYYKTAMYVSLVPMNIVEDFFQRKLAERRVVYYEDKDTRLTAFLLKTWSEFPDEPKKTDLDRLQNEPSVQLRDYDPRGYIPLMNYFEKEKKDRNKAMVLQEGKTLILYTYPVPEKGSDSNLLVGKWKEVSRDIDEYFGSVIEFKSDGTYTFAFTSRNVDAMIKNKFTDKKCQNMKPVDIRKIFSHCNPEKGNYYFSGNFISFISDNPIDGIKNKNGIAEAGSVSLSVKLINKPRLTFIKEKEKR